MLIDLLIIMAIAMIVLFPISVVSLIIFFNDLL